MYRWMTNSFGTTVCGRYRNNTTNYFLKGKMFQRHPNAWNKSALLAVTLRFQGAIAAQVDFRSKKFCKESCLHFTNECSAFVKAWKHILLPNHPDIDARFSCVKRPSRNAGDSPECVYYDRKESLEKEGMLVDRLVVRIFSALLDRRSVRRLVCQSSLSQSVNQ